MAARSKPDAAPAILPDDPVAVRILEYGRNHFFAHGFRGVTMDDLAKGLGISKKTLYVHFPSKSALLESVVFGKFHLMEAELDAIAARRSPGFSARLRELLECFQRHFGDIQPPFVRDIRREAPEIFQRIQVMRHQVIQRIFGKLFEQGRRAGTIRRDVPENLAIEVLLGAIQTVMNPQKIEEFGERPSTVFQSIISIVLEGSLTEKGRKSS